MSSQVICLVTIHGIGFEQAPVDGIPGYADSLHERLSRMLGPAVLGDDPGRSRTRPGQNGAIYAQSLWPPDTATPTREEGLARLGRWNPRPATTIDITGAPLVDGTERIAHVALVYSHLEPVGPHLGSGTVAATMAAVSIGHYASVMGLTRMAVTDIGAMVRRHPTASHSSPPSLQIRRDPLPVHSPLWGRLLPRTATGEPNPTGVLELVRNLENDVAAYVSRNDVRARVRSFVREALVRLLSRDDVTGVVINSHSNGTVVAFDVLRDLPAYLTQRVRWFVTAGSPLRKYALLFNWGVDVGGLSSIGGWTNFWDSKDPVADPLAPSSDWRRGDPLPVDAGQAGLYRWIDPDTGTTQPTPIEDRQVDNSRNGGGGGLPAHDYWDNESEVLGPLAAILQRLA